MKNSFYLIILLSLFSCSKEDITEPQINTENIDNVEYVYSKYKNIEYSLTSYKNKIPDLFKNSSDLMYGIEYPSDGVILDYNNDGFMDFIHTDSDYMSSFNGIIQRNNITFYLGDINGNLTLDTNNSNKFKGLIHGRKGIVADFNGDSYPDVFFAGHGLDYGQSWFEYPIALINKQNGEFEEHRLTDLVGYWHSVTSSDIDNDGKSEVILLSPNSGIKSFILNYENGFVYREVNIPMEWTIAKFSLESIDINNDGYVDIVLGGDAEKEHDNHGELLGSYIWLNSSDGFGNDMISLPLSEKIKEFTTVLDMNFYDLDKDGDLDIILSRTRDYNMHYIQILKNTNNVFEDVTDNYISNNFYFDGGAVERLYIGDFNNDGIVDMRTNINHGDVVIWELINNKFSIK